MRKLISAAVVALALSIAAPAAAQEVLPTAQVERSTANLQRAMEASARMTALTAEVLNDPALKNPTSLEQYRAALEARLPRVEAVRAELREIEASMRAIPPVGSPGGSKTLLHADATVVGVADNAHRLEAVLGILPQLAEAIRSGDRERFVALSANLKEAVVIPMEAQSISLRADVAFTNPDEPAYSQMMAFACLNDGTVSYFRVLLDLRTTEQAVAELDAAIACAVEHASGGHAAVERLRLAAQGSSETARLNAALLGTWERMAVELDQIPVVLANIRNDVAAGRIQATKRTHDAAINDLRLRSDAIVAEQIQIQAAFIRR